VNVILIKFITETDGKGGTTRIVLEYIVHPPLGVLLLSEQ